MSELAEKLRVAVGEVLWNASNYPERVQSRLLGQDTGPLREKVVDAAVAVFREHTAPAGDEREALSEFLFTVYEHGSQPNALREADAILSFLRSRRGAPAEPAVDRRNRRCERCGHEMGNHAPRVGCVIEGCPCGQEPAEPAVTDEMVERAGRVMYTHWDEWDGDDQGHRELMRAALEAALSTERGE